VPGSITCEDVPYPHPVSYMPLTLYGQDIRLAYMDVAPQGTPNGKTVMLFHGMNFAGFYWGGPIEALRKEGFRVVVPDQIGFGRSSKPIMPYNFMDMARNSKLLLDHLKIEKTMIVGHSMGGMLAARFATQYPAATERVVIYNPIGLSDGRYDGAWGSIDDAYKRQLNTTYQNIYAGIYTYFSHDPKAWKPEFEKYVRVRYAWTLSGDWPRYAMVQTLIQRMPYQDPVVYDWAHIKAPTLAFGGQEDRPRGQFAERMKFIADSVPNGNGRVHLLPGVGHVPHFEAPEKTYPPLLAFLKEGLAK
jgi:pimeloyl-ACP methyl ester carboxylesterase